MSKGSNRRPAHINDSEMQDRWDMIFSKGKSLEGSSIQYNALIKHSNHLLNDDIDGFNEENEMFGKKPAKDNKPMPGKKGKKC